MKSADNIVELTDKDIKKYIKDQKHLTDKQKIDLTNKVCSITNKQHGITNEDSILDEFCKKEGSYHYIMDINTNEFIETNIKPYNDRVTYILGESADSFKTFNHNNQTKEFLDFLFYF